MAEGFEHMYLVIVRNVVEFLIRQNNSVIFTCYLFIVLKFFYEKWI